MLYSKSICGTHGIRQKLNAAKAAIEDGLKDPIAFFEGMDFGLRLKVRSMNNPMFAKKVEDVFLPSNVVILSLLALAAYIFIFGPGAEPTLSTVLWFLVFSSWSIVVMEMIRRNVGDASKHNGMTIRISVVALIIPLMLMQTVGIPPIMEYIVVTFLVMSPVLYAIRTHWKISGHMCTYTAMSTIMTLISGWFAPLFLFIPIISWSRMKLKAHTAAQVFAGTLVGFIVPFTFALLLPVF